MEPHNRTELQSRISMFHPFSSKLGVRAPQFEYQPARSHLTGLRLAVSEHKALRGKGSRP
jgi:hypothetical protein